MSKPRVFVTRIIPERGLRKVMEQTDATVWQDELPPPREVLLEWAQQADGLLTLLTDRIDAELLDAAPRLKVVANFAVGFDNFDVPAATQRGVLMTNTPGVLTETTADFAFALLMACARRIVEGRDYAKNGHWRTWGPMLLLGQDIHGATLGIAGIGRIGQAVARHAASACASCIMTPCAMKRLKKSWAPSRSARRSCSPSPISSPCTCR